MLAESTLPVETDPAATVSHRSAPVESDPATLAAAALRHAAVRPEEALALSERAETLGRAQRDWPAVSVALRAAGDVALQQGRLDLAVERLSASIDAAQRGGESELAGEARMRLAAAVVQQGNTARGLAVIERALGELRGTAAARGRVQRAAIRQGLGRIDEALEDLRLALPVLRRGGDVEWEVRALSNRSSMFGGRRQFAAAEADLVRAQEQCSTHGLALGLAYVEHNLGWLRGERGDVPLALEHFGAAEERYAELGMEVGSLPLDRASVLLSVRLLGEARHDAEAAIAIFTRQRRTMELPEAQLVLSTVALLQGDLRTAERAADDAVRLLRRLGRTEWLALARYQRLQARLERVGEPDARAVTASHLRRAALDLEAAGWTTFAQEARVLAARRSLADGRTRAARADLALAARARRAGPADVRARAWYAEAMLRRAEGSRAGAKSALRAGLRVLEEHRASLGAVELRAHVAVRRGGLARAGLQMALEEGDARGVHWWGEQGRASADRLRTAHAPQDPVLAHALQDLRATMAELAEEGGQGHATAALVARQVQLEQQVRDHTRRFPSSVEHTASPPGIAELAGRLGETALVEFVSLGLELHAVTLVAGRARLHRLGPVDEVRHALGHLPFALRRLVHPRTPVTQVAAAEKVLARAGQVLDERLLAPLAAELGDRPLLVVPTGWLRAVPWSILPSCAGRPVSVVPSTALWFTAAQRVAPVSGVVSIGGPGLPGAAAEARAVAALYPEALVLTGTGAVAARVAQAMDGARVAHVAAHGTARTDNPLFSSLLLEDGPFTVYDLERLAATPHQVTLAACNAGLSHLAAGEETLGLATALLGHQTATLVAPVVPIADAETAPVMTTFHQLLRSGRGPAEALAAAQQRHARDGVRTRASAAGFLCLGVG